MTNGPTHASVAPRLASDVGAARAAGCAWAPDQRVAACHIRARLVSLVPCIRAQRCYWPSIARQEDYSVPIATGRASPANWNTLSFTAARTGSYDTLKAS